MKHRFIVGSEDAGLRLDQVLAARVPDLSRRKARVVLDIGGVFVDGARVKTAGRLVRRGQRIEVTLGGALERANKEVGRQARARDDLALPAFSITFEDTDLVVVDKPAGLLTAPTPESDRMNLAFELERRLGAPIYVVHRLDLPTSGLLVFARTERANRALSERFRTHDVDREYLAAVEGCVPWEQQTVNAPIQGRAARTHFQVEERFTRATLLRCRLETGRTHQIRIHCQSLGHPILGDSEYGRPSPTLPPRMALHATILGIMHPCLEVAMRWESPLPSELSSWLGELRAPRLS